MSSCIQPGLFGGLLNALHTNDDAAVAVAADVLTKLLGKSCFTISRLAFVLHQTMACSDVRETPHLWSRQKVMVTWRWINFVQVNSEMEMIPRSARGLFRRRLGA